MAFITGDGIPDPFGTPHFWVVFKQDKITLAHWPVPTQQEGEAQIVKLMKEI